MIKNLLLIICFCFINAAVAGISPFSQVRSVGKDDKGNPIEEIIDLTICLERIPSDGNLSDDILFREVKKDETWRKRQLLCLGHA